MQNNLIKIYLAKDQMDAEIKKTLLESFGIKVLIKNADVQSVFGVGNMGTGYNLAMGAVQLWVWEKDKEKAMEILAREKEAQKLNFEEEENPEEKIENKSRFSYSKGSLAAAIFVITSPIAIVYGIVGLVKREKDWIFAIFGLAIGSMGLIILTFMALHWFNL